jgi:hypothetical protein
MGGPYRDSNGEEVPGLSRLPLHLANLSGDVRLGGRGDRAAQAANQGVAIGGRGWGGRIAIWFALDCVWLQLSCVCFAPLFICVALGCPASGRQEP